MKIKTILSIALIIQFSCWLFFKYFLQVRDKVAFVSEVLVDRVPMNDANAMSKNDTVIANSLILDAPDSYFDIKGGNRLMKDTNVINAIEYNITKTKINEDLEYKIENQTLKITNKPASEKQIGSKKNFYSSFLSNGKPLNSTRTIIKNHQFKSIVVGPFTNVDLKGYDLDTIDNLNVELNIGASLKISNCTINNLTSQDKCGAILILQKCKVTNLHHISNGGTISGITEPKYEEASIKNATIIQGNNIQCNAIITLPVTDSLKATLNAENPMNLIYDGNPILKTSISKQNRIQKYSPSQSNRQ